MNDEHHNEAVANTLKYSTEQFDKSILFIASGAFAISFAFIKDIVPNLQSAMNKHYLINSWYVFAGTIFISLISHFISMQANTWAMKNYDLDNDTFNTKIMYWNWPIRILNIIMILAILVGALMLIFFINSNL